MAEVFRKVWVRRMENVDGRGFQVSVGQEDGEFDGRGFLVSACQEDGEFDGRGSQFSGKCFQVIAGGWRI